VDVSDAEADAMTLADNARGLQGRDDDAAVVEMASQFGRESALMADVGFDASALDALVKRAGDAMLSGEAGLPSGDAPTYKGDPDGREYDEGVEAEVDALTCPHCGKLVPRGS
jgi:hypothetical protein